MANQVDHIIFAAVWESYEGVFSGITIGQEENISALGQTQKEVLKQIKEWADDAQKNRPWEINIGYTNPKLLSVPVKIRPEIRLRKKLQPYSDYLHIKYPCVLIHEAPGLFLANFPTLDVEFGISDESDVIEMGGHLLSSQLSGKTIVEILGLIPPKNITIESITVKKSNQNDDLIYYSGQNSAGYALRTIAEPLIQKRRIPQSDSGAFERDEEIESLTRILSQEGGNIILLGEPGCGKSTILRHAARKSSKVNESKSDSDSDDMIPSSRNQYWVTNGSKIIAGMKYLGEWEERCETMIHELGQVSGVLCFQSFLDLIRLGGATPVNSIASFLQPYLQRGEIRVVCEASPTELDQARRLLPGFVNLFQIFRVNTLKQDKAIPLMCKVADSISESKRISIEDKVPSRVYHLFSRFQSYSAFPGPAVRFLRSLSQQKDVIESKQLSISSVDKVFSTQTGLPPVLFSDDKKLLPEDITRSLSKHVIGQSHAVQLLGNVVVRLKAGMNDPLRPVGVYLFCGPTGVGKTALAKALSNYLYGQGKKKDNLIRVDMSEFNYYGAARRLVDSPDGKPSSFIKQARQSPFSVILFDEIEKADSEVFDLILNLLDEGYITDSLGRITWFRSSIIIMTSNVGATSTKKPGFDRDSTPDYESEVMKFFRPEFFNRLDGVIPFRKLDKDAILKIASIELAQLSKRPGLRQNGLALKPETSVIAYIADKGFDPEYGARPLLRFIEDAISVPLSKWLLENPNLKNREILLSINQDNQISFS